MQLAFITSFSIENRLQEDIFVTTVGTYGPEGKRSVLPQFACKFPALPAFANRDLKIEAGKTRIILYDWDDINFSEILVRTNDWEKVLVVEPKPPKDGNYYQPKKDLFVIDDAKKLVIPTREIINIVAETRGLGLGWIWFLTIAGFVSPAVFFYSIYKYGKLKKPKDDAKQVGNIR